MSEFRIGIIGMGFMGTGHAQYILKNEVPGAVLGAVCDASQDRLKWVRETNDKVKCFTNYDELLASKSVDGILIATHHYIHPELAIKAFETGHHVLTEKPAGVYTKHVREMNAAAAKSGKVFTIMFQSRAVPLYKKLKDLVASGEIGEVKRTEFVATDWLRSQFYYDSGGWRATWAGEGGGVLLNQAPHSLDLWQWVGGMPTRVRAFCHFGKHHNIEVEDDVTAYVEYANGAVGTFVASTGEAPGDNRFTISGDKGKLLLQDGKITFWRNRVPTSQFLRESKESFDKPETWKIEIPASTENENHKAITKSWVKTIQTGAPLIVQGDEGLASLELCNAMLLSTWTDNWVTLPVDEDLYYAKLQERIKASTFKKK